jgi:hypothetical protein
MGTARRVVLFGALLGFAVVQPAAAAPRLASGLVPPPVGLGQDPVPPRPTTSGPATLSRGTPDARSPWHALVNTAPFNPGAMLLLTDGTVLVQDQGPDNRGTSAWWRLTPDSSGSYLNGTWTQVASLPANYAPLYFASAVLPDGRVIIEGGEYNLNHPSPVWTNRGAIYDPLANTWTAVAHPKGSEWVRIGDGPGTVLANGQFMLGASGFSGTTAEALLDPTTLTWKKTGAGKADGNGEEGWSLLPNGKVLTVDTTDTAPAQNTELYTPSTGTWSSAGTTPVPLVDSIGEVGPQLLRPDGTVFAVGATGSNAIYDTKTGTWSAGPSFPVIGGLQYDTADGAAAVLPDGHVLVNASPGDYQTPTHFFVFDGTNLTQVADPANAANQSSGFGFMVVLPTGQVLFNDRIGDLEVYDDNGTPQPSWRPRITTVPTTLAAGATYTVSGRQLGGLTQAAAYGDDYQSATNYPLVRITMTATGHVYFARTAGMTAMSVAPNAKSSAQFSVPAGIEAGSATLVVVANGIASAPVPVTVTAAAQH